MESYNPQWECLIIKHINALTELYKGISHHKNRWIIQPIIINHSGIVQPTMGIFHQKTH